MRVPNPKISIGGPGCLSLVKKAGQKRFSQWAVSYMVGMHMTPEVSRRTYQEDDLQLMRNTGFNASSRVVDIDWEVSVNPRVRHGLPRWAYDQNLQSSYTKHWSADRSAFALTSMPVYKQLNDHMKPQLGHVNIFSPDGKLNLVHIEHKSLLPGGALVWSPTKPFLAVCSYGEPQALWVLHLEQQLNQQPWLLSEDGAWKTLDWSQSGELLCATSSQPIGPPTGPGLLRAYVFDAQSGTCLFRSRKALVRLIRATVTRTFPEGPGDIDYRPSSWGCQPSGTEGQGLDLVHLVSHKILVQMDRNCKQRPAKVLRLDMLHRMYHPVMSPNGATFVGLSLCSRELIHHSVLDGKRHVIVSGLSGGFRTKPIWAPKPFGGPSVYACILDLQPPSRSECRAKVALVSSHHHRLIGMACIHDLASCTISSGATRYLGHPLRLSWSPSGASLAIDLSCIIIIVNSPYQWFRHLAKAKA